ncbi:MAG: transposase [Gordonibacter sp.]|nr:transposase [Gordonibacter sp.]
MKRRTRVVQSFPSRKSLIHLVKTVLFDADWDG